MQITVVFLFYKPVGNHLARAVDVLYEAIEIVVKSKIDCVIKRPDFVQIHCGSDVARVNMEGGCARHIQFAAEFGSFDAKFKWHIYM